jgi:hypothetical protein
MGHWTFRIDRFALTSWFAVSYRTCRPLIAPGNEWRFASHFAQDE